MEKSIKSLAMTRGVYLGILLTIVTVMAYVIDLGLMVKWWYGIILLLVMVVFGVATAIGARKLLGGFISFKNAFASYFTTIVIAMLISTVIGLLLFQVIDPEATDILEQKIIENTTAMMEGFGAPQSDIDKTILAMGEQDQFSMANQVKSLAWQLLVFAIIGLIAALAVKKTDPNSPDA